MPPWSDPIWVPTGLALALLGIIVTPVLWLRPHSPKHGKVTVAVSNDFLVYDQPDGSRSLGDHLVGVTIANGGSSRVKVVAWGLRLPGNRSMVMTRQLTPVEPSLPHWIESGDHAGWFLQADEIRHQQATLGCKFSKMIAYVMLADGREVRAKKGVPLK